jgi:hypothetical protein
MNRPIRMKEMPEKERSHAERFRLAGDAWAEAKRQADLLEEMKGPTVEQMKCKLLAKLTEAGETKVPEARLEREVKASDEYADYIKGMCFAKERENKAWVERKAVEIAATETVDMNANYRTERKMS